MSDLRYDAVGDVLDKLVEECAEVIHVCAKIWRFGPYNYHPNDAQMTPNYELLRSEIKDLEQCIEEARRWIATCRIYDEQTRGGESQ